MSFTESAVISAPAEKVRRQCAQPGFLSRVIPGLGFVRWERDGWLRCGLDFEGMPATARVKAEQDGRRLRLRCEQPRCEITAELTPLRERRTALAVRVQFAPQTRGQHAQLDRAVRNGLDLIRTYLETEPGVPEPRAGRRDPLLHTGPRIPPEKLR